MRPSPATLFAAVAATGLILLLSNLPRSAALLQHPQRLTPAEHHARFVERAAARAHGTTGAVRASRPIPPGTAASVRTIGRVFYPTEYGADPTGTRDSSNAIAAAVGDAFTAEKGKELVAGINDLGGVVIDLQGGDYLISKPIQLPPGGGNVVVQGGTLRASGSFPGDRYLVELQLPPSSSRSMQYEDITFRDILFDAGYLGGGLLVVDSARIRIDNCFFIHFATSGIKVRGGHETFISSTFLGQHLTVGGDKDERNFSGTGIELDGNDNAVTDVAIFSAAVGIVLTGQANILTGVHCYNKATFFGGVGILVKLAGNGQTRIDNCYMDYTGIVIEDPVQVHVTNGFFLGDANVLLRSVKGVVSGLTVTDNMFTGSGAGRPIVALDESRGPFQKVEQAVVDRNSVDGMKLKATVAAKTVAARDSRWVVDFDDELLFPNRITHVQYSMYLPPPTIPNQLRGMMSNFPLHALTGISENKVVVTARNKVAAVISVMVDQYALPGEIMPYL